MEINHFPWRLRRCQRSFQPAGLPGAGDHAVGLVVIAVQSEEMHRPPGEIVITLVAGQGKVIQVGLGTRHGPIVVAQAGEEAVEAGAGAELACVRENIAVVISAEVRSMVCSAPSG